MSDLLYSQLEQVKLNNAIDEAVQSLMRQKGVERKEKDHRADIFEEVSKNQGIAIDKSTFTAFVNERFEGKSSDIVEKHEDIISWNEILENNRNSAPEATETASNT